MTSDNSAASDWVPVLPETKLPFELWEMYRLSDIKDRLATGEYARYATDDIRFLLACINKLSQRD